MFNRWALAEFLRCHATTQAELAKQADLSPGYITDLLKGNKRNPTRTSIRRIAQALDIDWRALYIEVPATVAEAVNA